MTHSALLVVAAAATLAGSFLVASCRQLASVEEQAACEGVESPLASCTTCLRSACCDAELACRKDADCRALDACIAASSSDEDRTNCGKAHPAGLRGRFPALAACRARACPECSGTLGGYVFRDAVCATCSESECRDQANACESSAECLSLSYCERQCRSKNNACRGECERLHPDGRELASRFTDCLALHCSSECEYVASNWLSCDPPPKSGIPVKLTVYVNRITSAVPLITEPAVGASVQACMSFGTWQPTQCQQGVVETNTKCAELDLPSGFKGALVTNGGGILDSYAYIDPPLADDKTITIEQLTPEQFKAVFAPLGVDPAKGHVALRAVDCLGDDAPGVSFSLHETDCSAHCDSPEPYYGRFGERFDTATIPGNGHGGFLNIPQEMTYDIIVTRRDTGRCVAMKSIEVHLGAQTTVSPIYPGGCPNE